MIQTIIKDENFRCLPSILAPADDLQVARNFLQIKKPTASHIVLCFAIRILH